jgi:hypothetical protein
MLAPSRRSRASILALANLAKAPVDANTIILGRASGGALYRVARTSKQIGRGNSGLEWF